ncbi:hypothetical protein PGT21_024541 [Puccinia graminis f. sp. tritici]|uniref:Guanylate kinase-like domain-containing protein n=1 Tax=Puccinia graminis f. sp. tritici TaxID=56615 RepID=A0A5B0NZ21_PUCGR|nr:hypothetical protein PGT21_024541 [Puccinia graminis f. sp. tritici]
MYKHSLHQLIQPIHQRLTKPSISFFINTPTKHPIRTTSTSMAPSASAQLQPIVVFGPSGSGKSTLIKRLQASQDWPKFGFSVSHTTRKPRAGEADGVAYHFVSRESFQEMVTKGEFIEHAEFGGNCYGTSLKAVSEVSEHQKKRCILDIDAQSGPSDLIIVNQNLDEAYRKFHLACTVNKNENPSQFPQSDPIPF